MVTTRATSKASKEIVSENFKLKQEITRLKSQVVSLKDSLREARADAESLREARRQDSIQIKTERQAHKMQIQNMEDQGKRLINDCTIGVSSMVRGFETIKKKVRTTCDLVKSAVESNTAAAVDNACTEFVKSITEPVTEINEACEGFRRIGAALLPTCYRCENTLNELTHTAATPPTTPQNAPSCQICFRSYSEQPGLVPRLLRCGHSFCEDCTWRMNNGKQVTCPMDRIPTEMISLGVKHLPKNFAVLDVCQSD